MRLPASTSRADVVALERRHVWPPYTSSERHESIDPLVIVGASGIYLEDADGRRYVDANSSWWTCTLGHGHPRLRAALVRQGEQLMHVAAGGITHAPVALLAKELCAAAPPGLTRVHFSDDGSTAVEAAVKAAFQYWQQNGAPKRTRFIALSGAYHGDTLGAASLASIEEFHHLYAPLLFEVIRPPADPGGWDRAIDHIERTLTARGDEIAGVIVEPLIQGASGMRMYEPELLARLRDATARADTFLIADEVFTGYGRTGAMWACERASITPDFMCVAKGFTAGVLPMAATLATDRVYDGFRGGADRALLHGHTFCGNPLGAAVAREVLAIYAEEQIVARVRRHAPVIEQAFIEIADAFGLARPRAMGMVGAVDLGEGGYHGALGWRVHAEARARGVFLRPLGDTIYVAPPLTIEPSELTELLAAVRDSIRATVGDRAR